MCEFNFDVLDGYFAADAGECFGRVCCVRAKEAAWWIRLDKTLCILFDGDTSVVGTFERQVHAIAPSIVFVLINFFRPLKILPVRSFKGPSRAILKPTVAAPRRLLLRFSKDRACLVNRPSNGAKV